MSKNMVCDLCTALGAKKMGNGRLGFTLMEIMVVVVIIAVLASVAGPMIGDIVNQGKASATRSKLAALKSAIVTYKNDVGRYPYFGERKDINDKAAYDQTKVLSINEANNVLVNRATLINTITGAIPKDTDGDEYAPQYGRQGRRWKGPYMDSDPADFMVDAWGSTFRYLAVDNSLILWSAGPDGDFHEISQGVPNKDIFDSDAYADGETDDLYISIARFRRPFNGSLPAFEDSNE